MRVKSLIFSFAFALAGVALLLGTLEAKAQTDPQLYEVMDGEIVSVTLHDLGGSYDATASCSDSGDTFSCSGLFANSTFGDPRATVDIRIVLTNTEFYSHVIGFRLEPLSLSSSIVHYRFPEQNAIGDLNVGEHVCNGPQLLPGEGLDGTWLNGSGHCESWHFAPSGNLDSFDFRFRFNSPSPQTGWLGDAYSATVKISWIMDSDFVPPEEPPPPSPKALPFAPFCFFTHTEVITNESGITSTIDIPYVRNSNLVENNSFEVGISTPDEWDSVIGGVITTVTDYYAMAEGEQNQGQDAVFNSQAFFLVQGVQLHGSSDYMLGGYVRGAPNVAMRNNSYVATPIAQTTISQTEYELITGTFSSGGGSPLFTIEFSSTTGTTYVDDVFVIPVTNTVGGYELNCDPDLYEVYIATILPDDTVLGPISPIPVGGAGTTCYLCTSPTFVTPNFVSYWIAWLGCVLRNMFACSLRVWMLVLGNWIKGLVEMGTAWIVWLPDVVQSVIDLLVAWANSSQVAVIDSVEAGADWLKSLFASIGGTVETGASFFDFLILLVELIGSFLALLSNLLLGIIDLIISIIGALPSAFEVDVIFLEINGEGSLGGPASDITTPGPTTGKILWLIYMPMRVIDQFAIGRFSEILVIGLGALSFGMLVWVIKWWQDFEI